MTTTLLASYDPEAIPTCLSNHASFCSHSHSSCFSHTSLFGIPQTHLASFYVRGFIVFVSLCDMFHSFLLLADFWSFTSQLKYHSISDIHLTSPSPSIPFPCLNFLQSPIFSFLYSPFRIPVMCLVELFSVSHIALIFFFSFFFLKLHCVFIFFCV